MLRHARSIRTPVLLALTLAVVALAAGCNRNMEPFDPDEEPVAPDLSQIFPEGAKRAAEGPPTMPEAPRPTGGRGTMGGAAAADATAQAPPIEGTIRIADELAAGAPSNAVLFIIARRGAGGPPLAVKRVQAPSFPVAFTLGPEDRMIQSMPFAGPLQVTVRLDSDGNATSRTPGDLQGTAPRNLEPGATGVDITLDERI